MNANSEEEDDDSDWDSEPELQLAQVQEAARITRRIPSIRRQKSTNTLSSNHTTTKAEGSPYYCEEIGPQLDLGYQWPQDIQLKKSHGFVKVSPGSSAFRQRDIDRHMLAKRRKVKQSNET